MHRSGAAMAWNIFKFCTALKGLGSIMILLVLALVGVSYYAIVITNYGPQLIVGGLDSLIAFLVLIAFHFLLVMLLWSYFSVVFTDPGGVPPNWQPAMDEETGDTDPLNTTEFSVDPENGEIRICRKCNQLKPPRCHHCSVSKWEMHIEKGSSLYLGRQLCRALNYEYFLLFLFYTFLETTIVTLSLLPYFIVFFSDGDIPGTLATIFLAFDKIALSNPTASVFYTLLIVNLISCSFESGSSLSVMGFLIMRISLVAGNTTTIAALEKKIIPKWRYDLGRRKNFEQVFGTDKNYWFIPKYSDEDLRRMPALQGLEYPSKPESDAQEF